MLNTKLKNLFVYLIVLTIFIGKPTILLSQCNFTVDTVTTSNQVINTYFSGVTNNVGIGSTSITFGPSTGATTPIEEGDMLLIIQIQDAQINSTNTTSYGSGVPGDPSSGFITSTAGNYEFVFAANDLPLSGGVLNLKSPTIHSYVNEDFGTNGQKRYQVMRVPRFQNLTIAPGASISAQPWNGRTGGIVVLDIIDTLNMNNTGTINVSGLGFRGGGARRLLGASGLNNTDRVVMSTINANASKGEGIAGTPRYVNHQWTLLDTGVEGYPNGSYGMGAPGNAGGGGTDGNPSANDDNSGGGGGGNGGAGGRGGNSWRSNVPSGGFGGVKPNFISIDRLIFGGGGGAGTINDNPTIAFDASGAAGGGIVILRVGTIVNPSIIEAKGLTARDVLNDGAGGGGAGGSVFIEAQNSNSLANLIVNVNGGNGGNVWPLEPDGGFPGNRHGPGGGGGAGVIYANGPLHPNSSAARGLNGTATNVEDSFGSIPGFEGVEDETVPGIPIYNSNNFEDDICETPKIQITISPQPVSYENIGDIITFTITVTNNGNATLNSVLAEASNIGFSAFIDTLAVGSSQVFNHTYTINSSDINNGSKYVLVTVEGYDSNSTIVVDDDNTRIFELAYISGCPDLAVSRIQYAFSTSNSTVNTATFSTQPTEGNLIVVISTHRQDGEIPSINGTGWTLRTTNRYGIAGGNYGPANTNHRRGIAIWTKIAGPNEPLSVQTSWSPTSENSIMIQEFNFVGGTLVFNSAVGTNSGTNAVTSLNTSNSGLTNAENSLIFTAVSARNDANNMTNPSWSNGISNSVGVVQNGRAMYSAFGLSHTTGQKNSTATWSNASLANAVIVVFDIIPSVPPIFPDITVTQPNCDIQSGSIEFTTPLGSQFEYTIDNGNSFQNSPVFSGLGEGQFTVYARDKNTQCTSGKQVASIVTFDNATCGSCPPAIPITRRQSKLGTSAGSTNNAEFDSDILEGNLLVATAVFVNNNTTPSISGSGWTLRRYVHFRTDNNNRRGLAIWTKIAGSSEPKSITSTFSSFDNTLIVQEFAIPDGTSITYFGDAGNNSGTSTVAAISSGNISNNTLDDFFVVATVGGRNDMGSPYTFSNGLDNVLFANVTSGSPSNRRSLAVAYNNLTTSNNISTTASWPTERHANAAIIAFKVTKPEPLPQPTVNLAQTDCFNNNGTIEVTAPLGANIEYTINGTDFQSSPTFNNVPSGNYPLRAINVLTGCSSEVRNVVIYKMICASDVDLGTRTIAGANNIVNTLANDEFDNSVADTSVVNISITSHDITGTILLNTQTGALSVAQNKPHGTHTLTYRICDKNEPGNCDEAIVTVYIEKGIIINEAYCYCYQNTPLLTYNIAPNFPTSDSVSIIWSDMTNNVIKTITHNFYIGQSLYPGVELDIDNNVINWPGWLQNAYGEWYEGNDGFEMLKPNAKIVFSINPISDTVIVTYPDQDFDCIVQPTSNLLPVTWLSFEGTKDKETVVLEWKTASEVNNDYFNIERSIDGENFEKIGTVMGAGNSNNVLTYNFIDYEPEKGYNYYRLKQVDFDAAFEYSNTIAVNFGANDFNNIKVFPNPFLDKVVIDNGDKKIGYIRLHDKTGKIVYDEFINETIKTVYLEHIETGIYYLSNENGIITKLVKNNR